MSERGDFGLVLETSLRRGPSAPRTARALIRDALGEWASDGFAEVTEILVSEVVTNAVLHGSGAIALRACASPDRRCLRVEVDDDSPQVPKVPDTAAPESGRGVLIVEALASRWGSEARPFGKTVWFELEADTAETHHREEG